MVMIALRDVDVTNVENLFSNVSFTVSRGDRIGIVGNNGAGKSTLIRCMVGAQEPSRGEIIRNRKTRVGVVGQEVPAALFELTMTQALVAALPEHAREDESWKAGLLLDELGTSEADRETKVGKLSGGWQRLVMIGRCWLGEPDVLVLDEPTNHLDIAKILWLERWLNKSLAHQTIVVVSHDRSFLDNCTKKTLLLRSFDSKFYAHPYTEAARLLAESDDAARGMAERTTQRVKRLQASAHNLRQIGVNNHSDAALRKAIHIRKRAELLEETVPQLPREDRRDISLSNRDTHHKHMLALEQVTISVPDGRPLFRIDRLMLARGERLVLFGENGSGKSLFIKFLVAELARSREDRSRGVAIASTAVGGYLDQHISILPPDAGVLAHLDQAFTLGRERCRSMLVNAGFGLKVHDLKIGALSSGERSRLALLHLRLRTPNFYLMDEPTNHLDIAGQVQLEEQINAVDATSVIISHDRRFVANVGNRFVVIRRGRLEEIESPEAYFADILPR